MSDELFAYPFYRKYSQRADHTGEIDKPIVWRPCPPCDQGLHEFVEPCISKRDHSGRNRPTRPPAFPFRPECPEEEKDEKGIFKKMGNFPYCSMVKGYGFVTRIRHDPHKERRDETGSFLSSKPHIQWIDKDHPYNDRNPKGKKFFHHSK